MAKRSRYQEKIIKNYYENRDSIALQRVQELVTELYLSEGKKRQQYWKSIRTHLEKLGVGASELDHLVAQDDPELVAQVVQKIVQKT